MSILEIRDLTKTFDGIKAVDSFSAGFEEGQITALVGPNGAGKTTLFNLINGFIKPDSGEILFKGKNIVGLSPYRIARLGIGRIFQDVRIFNRLSALDNVLCAFNDLKGEGVFYSVFLRWKMEAEERYYIQKALELLKFVGLEDKAGELAENLSYGQQKLLSIARLLACGADVLLLDEPTAGVNPQMVGKLLELIKDLAKSGKTLIIIEHNMNVVVEVANWVYFMDEGQVTSFGLPADVLGDPEVRKAYIGI